MIAGMLLMSGCMTAVPSGEAPSSPLAGRVLAGTAWVLDSIGGEPPLADTTITLRFEPDGSLMGSSGCNYYSAEFTEGSGTLVVDNMSSTLMLCAEELGAQEDGFLAMLGSVKRYSLEDEHLTLSDDAEAPLAVFSVQSQELTGSTWTIESYNGRAGAVMGMVEGSAAEIIFGEDGTVSGSGGCNNLVGEFTAKDGGLQLGPLAMTRMACQEPAGVMEQETAVVKALESATSYTVEGDRLHLKTEDDATAAELTRG